MALQSHFQAPVAEGRVARFDCFRRAWLRVDCAHQPRRPMLTHPAQRTGEGPAALSGTGRRSFSRTVFRVRAITDMSENQPDSIAASLEEPRSSAPATYWLVSVIALLGFACFPVLAEADSSSIQYEEAVPTATGKGAIRSHSGTSAHASTTNGGGATAKSQSGSTAPGSGGLTSAGAQTSRTGKGTVAQNRQLKRAELATNNQTRTPGRSDGSSMQTSSGRGSSPLVPILIAIAALAAISIAAMIVRQRRQRRSPGPSGGVQAEIAEHSVAPCKPVLAPPDSGSRNGG